MRHDRCRRVLASLVLVCTATPLAAQIALEPLGAFRMSDFTDYEDEVYDQGAAESLDYDAKSHRAFTVNRAKVRVDIIDISDPTAPEPFGSIDITPFGPGLTSVAVRKGHDEIAVAVEGSPITSPGKVVFFDTDGEHLGTVTVGSLPDKVVFSPNGQVCLAANEGEPNSDYDIDPEGSVSIIRLKGSAARVGQEDVCTVDFGIFDGTEAMLRAAGIRIFGPGASASQDFEPEYIAVSHDSRKAWVTLQENNAILEVDIKDCKATNIFPLGYKDHSIAGNGLDASDDDGEIHIANWPVRGMYLPDAIASYRVNGRTYLLTANEGDVREYDGFDELNRVRDLSLDATAFPDAATLQEDENLGRLRVTNTMEKNASGDFTGLFSFGARSFSIWTTDGDLVFDSGDDFEQITAAELPADFNSDNAENDSFDNRSDDKGPEPESVELGRVGSRVYAFIGFERVGGVIIYDVTDPHDVELVAYHNDTRDFGGVVEDGTAGDCGPEIVRFVPGSESPNHRPLLLVSNEISGDTRVWQVVETP